MNPWTTSAGSRITGSHGDAMTELLILLIVVGVWIFLQAYLLPKLGVST
jgi:hypothetical protein